MSAPINFNSPILQTIPSYHSSQLSSNATERRIDHIDRRISANNERISITRELIGSNNKLITAKKEYVVNLKEAQVLRRENLETRKESRNTGQRIVDKSEQLLACYKKLLEIRREKNASNGNVVTTHRNQPPNRDYVSGVSENPPSKKQVYIENVRALGRELEYKPTKWTKVKTPRLEGHNDMYIDFKKHNKEYVTKIDGNSDKILQNKRILENYSQSLSGAKIGGRAEEDKIAEIIDQNTNLQNLSTKYLAQMKQARIDYYDFINSKKEEQGNFADAPKELTSRSHYSPVENSSVVKFVKQQELEVINPKTPILQSMSMPEIISDATLKLGDVLFDHYKDDNKALAMNIRDRFFQELEYDSSKNVVSANSSLEKVFNSFANYLKVGEYSYLKGNNHFLNDLQNRLLSCNIQC